MIIILLGDLILEVENPDHWLSGIAPELLRADIAIGHLEVPHTVRGVELEGDVPAIPAPPENLDALKRAGITAVTLAGNHIADRGAQGIEDTLHRLDQLGIAYTGAGACLDDASRPAFIEKCGKRLALLSYNCVGPESAWAGRDRFGCNYLRIDTSDGSPITPAAPLCEPAAEALERLRRDIASARENADLCIVALHKGIVHTPATLAPYERPLARAAVEAGADVVIGHHAHIVRGVESIEGRPVFHGLGNGCVVTNALSPQQDHVARAAWARRREELFGFVPDPAYTLAPFHPEAVHAMLGVVEFREDGALRTGIIPVFVEPPGRPVCVEDSRADDVMAYIEKISLDAGLPVQPFERVSAHMWMRA